MKILRLVQQIAPVGLLAALDDSTTDNMQTLQLKIAQGVEMYGLSLCVGLSCISTRSLFGFFMPVSSSSSSVSAKSELQPVCTTHGHHPCLLCSSVLMSFALRRLLGEADHVLN